jgi:NMT1/THI5 like
MLQQKLYEQAAKQFGYDLTVDYQDYPSAAPMVELMTAGKLDIGMWGNTPTIRSIAQQQPVTAMTIGEGHLKFLVAVPAESAIHNMADLKGKTVGALIGGATFNVLSQMLKAEFGDGNPQNLGITVVNTPSAADAARLPRGMDAAVITLPSYLQANRDVQTTAIVNSFGYSEAPPEFGGVDSAMYSRTGRLADCFAQSLCTLPYALFRTCGVATIPTSADVCVWSYCSTMPQQPSTWNGTQQESLDLAAAIDRHCTCECDLNEERAVTCSPHRMLMDDQRALDGLVFMRHIAERLRLEEFAPPWVSASD